MDTVDPLVWVYIFGASVGVVGFVIVNISSRRYDRKFGRERDRPKAP